MGDKKKVYSFGACAFNGTSPQRDKLCSTTKILNIFIPFEEALKLNLSIDECVRKLNRYDRRTARGKEATVRLMVHLDTERIDIHEA